MTNKKVRIAMAEHDVKQYRLAQIMGKHESAISKLLRDELPDSEQTRIVHLIEEEARKNGARNDS